MEPIICDFGISKEKNTDDDLSKSIQSFGTYRWCSPEGFDEYYSYSYDVYSFGSLLYELFMNILPWSYEGLKTRKEVEEQVKVKFFNKKEKKYTKNYF
jgi:serine/threonine protein kinase